MNVVVFKSFKHVEAKSVNKKSKPRKSYKFRPPEPMQEVARYEVVQFLLHNRGERRKYVYSKLKERFGLEVKEKRIYKSGGVGQWSWMKRKRCFRVQVGASKITTKRDCYPYAPVVEIY